MMIQFQCRACRWHTSVGSYHRFNDCSWGKRLYCKHCGQPYRLEESGDQFIDGFGLDPPQRTERIYTLHGAGVEVSVRVAEGEPCPTLTCHRCGAEGPFGNGGPIVGYPPETCPKCGGGPVKKIGECIT